MSTFKNQEALSHAWAQYPDCKPNGKCNGGLFYEGKTIYSYGFHFPIAIHVNENLVLFNNQSYSVSTHRQQVYVRRAIPATKKIVTLPYTFMIKAFDKSYLNLKGAYAECCAGILGFTQGLIETAADIIENHPKRKKPVAQAISEALEAINNAQALGDALGLKLPVKLKNLKAKIENDSASLIAFAMKEKAKLERAQEKRRQEQKRLAEKDCAEWVIDWQAGKTSRSAPFMYDGPIMLRLENDGQTIRTSMNAEFPLQDAIKALPFIVRARNNKTGFELSADNFIRLGAFKIDRVDTDGNVTAGCHFVPWESIEKIAAQLNLALVAY